MALQRRLAAGPAIGYRVKAQEADPVGPLGENTAFPAGQSVLGEDVAVLLCAPAAADRSFGQVIAPSRPLLPEAVGPEAASATEQQYE